MPAGSLGETREQGKSHFLVQVFLLNAIAFQAPKSFFHHVAFHFMVSECMSHPSKPRHYTRKTGAALIREVYGIDFPDSRFDKDAISKKGQEPLAPAPVAVYGRTHLYTEEQILAYGNSLIRSMGEVDQSATRNAEVGVASKEQFGVTEHSNIMNSRKESAQPYG